MMPAPAQSAATLSASPPASPENVPLDPSSRGAKWLSAQLGRVEIGKTTVQELYKRMGKPESHWDHGEGTSWYAYPGTGLANMADSRRRFVARGDTIIGLTFDDPQTTPERVHERLAGLRLRDLTATEAGYPPSDVRILVVCEVPQASELGVLFLFSNGLLAEGTVSPSQNWTLPKNPCKH